MKPHRSPAAQRRRRKPRRSARSARLLAVAVVALLVVVAGLAASGSGTRPSPTAETAIDTASAPSVRDPSALDRVDGTARAPRDDAPPSVDPQLTSFEVSLSAPARSADISVAAPLSDKEQKQLDKLVKKYNKKSAQLADFEGRHADALAELAAAQAALAAAEAMPESSIWEWLDKKKAIKKAEKLIKKWTWKAAQYQKKVAKLSAQVNGYVADIEDLDPDYFESGLDPGGGGIPSGDVTVPFLVQEAVPQGNGGVNRLAAVATFGLPFPKGQVPLASNARPALAVSGSDVYQFRALDMWDDGTVRWALCDVQTDIGANQITVGLDVVGGDGTSGQQTLARTVGNTIQLDTGPLQVEIDAGNFNLFRKVTVDGTQIVDGVGEEGLWGRTTGGALLTPGNSTDVIIEENGPARAVVRADGDLVSGGQSVVDFTCRIVARADSRDVEIIFTVRNAKKSRNQHVILESIELSAPASVGNNKTVAISGHNGEQTGALGSGVAYLHMGYTNAPTYNTDAWDYYPHLPNTPGSYTQFVDEGYQLKIGSNLIHDFGNKGQYPGWAYLDLTGSKGGITVAIRQMPYFWPAALEASGSGGGEVTAGIFTGRNPAPYTFVWRQHESRTAVFSFHKGPLVNGQKVARKLDYPVVGRAADYDHYDSAGVFPYRLLTIAEQNEAYSLMGIAHTVESLDEPLKVCRYLGSSTTGGPNNMALIEDNLIADWLRHGEGGSYLAGLDLALYKSEWQVPRSDDFYDGNDPDASNDHVQHTWRHRGDQEHRYREGMILAFYLTGDQRYSDALYDEAEVLHDIYLYSQGRSMWQTIRAQAIVAEFTGDDQLPDLLRQRINYNSSQHINIYTTFTGWGWQGPPDSTVNGRKYYVWGNDLDWEKPPGENFQTRGFFHASLGEIAWYHAARFLGPSDPMGAEARGRMRDLSFWTRDELFPNDPNPANRHIPYSYAVTLEEHTNPEKWDFHPILFGMAETFLDTGDPTFLERGIDQLEAHQAHDDGPFSNNLYLLDTRPDCQHFFAVYREWALN